MPDLDSATDSSLRHRPIRHAIAVLATVCAWPLLFIGGLVTTFGVGMAVPDWPTTFGINMFLYDMSRTTWGVFVEHGHRLYASLVGLSCVVLAVWFTLSSGRLRFPLRALSAAVGVVGLTAGWLVAVRDPVDPFLLAIGVLAALGLLMSAWYAVVERRGATALAWLALVAVIGQGVLGGYRVRLNSTDLAAFHGVLGQAFFALMVTLCVVTGRVWSRVGSDPMPPADRFRLRRLAPALAALLFAQLVTGALLRHRGSGFALHLTLALAVLLSTYLIGGLTLRGRRSWPSLAPAAWAALILVTLQVALGVGAWLVSRPFDGVPRTVTGAAALTRTAHQANGALLLAASVVLALRARRGLRSPARATAPSPAPAPHPAARDLESVTP